MLRTRIITALVLLPLILAAIYWLPLAGFALVFWLIAAAAAWEWTALAGIGTLPARAGYLLVLALLCAAVWILPALGHAVLLAGALFWVGAVIVVLAYPGSGRWLSRPVLMGAGWLVTLAAWSALVVIRSGADGAHWVLWSMLLVWGADIGAYFAGRRFGRRKLAPQVSPGKTWEGAVGGGLLALLVTGLMLWVMGYWAYWWLPVILLLAVVSVFGDLFESVLKRHAGVKDSGALLPGHGGALDRIDSLLAVLPLFALIVSGQSAV